MILRLWRCKIPRQDAENSDWHSVTDINRHLHSNFEPLLTHIFCMEGQCGSDSGVICIFKDQWVDRQYRSRIEVLEIVPMDVLLPARADLEHHPVCQQGVHNLLVSIGNELKTRYGREKLCAQRKYISVISLSGRYISPARQTKEYLASPVHACESLCWLRTMRTDRCNTWYLSSLSLVGTELGRIKHTIHVYGMKESRVYMPLVAYIAGHQALT